MRRRGRIPAGAGQHLRRHPDGARVKMNAKHEYEYVANYKIMQTAFKNKKIDKPIPVEKLVKCKMQDNLEFLQWLKHFWDANYGGGEYDAVARRKGAPADPPATLAPIVAPGPARSTHAAAPARAGGRTPISAHRSGTPNDTAVQALNGRVRELSQHLEGLEKEREFYFEKHEQGQLEQWWASIANIAMVSSAFFEGLFPTALALKSNNSMSQLPDNHFAPKPSGQIPAGSDSLYKSGPHRSWRDMNEGLVPENSLEEALTVDEISADTRHVRFATNEHEEDSQAQDDFLEELRLDLAIAEEGIWRLEWEPMLFQDREQRTRTTPGVEIPCPESPHPHHIPVWENAQLGGKQISLHYSWLY
ncbi:hypothetical protein B0H14DRAFT_3149827 [Mycena olivaceomarginata]|nr:hypothetical protein B0H14DRAFT_3149827 [Mycena olivaceomarginata]